MDRVEKIIFVRTFRDVGTGGAIPPVDCMYCAQRIEDSFAGRFKLEIVDTGVLEPGIFADTEFWQDKFAGAGFVCFSAMVWEADCVHTLAGYCARFCPDAVVAVFGQLPTLVGEFLLKDPNIDVAVFGEPDQTVAGLAGSVFRSGGLEGQQGIVYRQPDGTVRKNFPAPWCCSLDEWNLSDDIRDLVDVTAYARFANWNGFLKKKSYYPLLTSRGCPMTCTFCSNPIFMGRAFRARSPQNVVDEIVHLYNTRGVREFHVFDMVFNFDMDRAKQICRLIIDSGLKISLAFPHGLRADFLDDELIELLYRAGTYKLHFGIETGCARMQKQVGKNLDLERLKTTITKTTKTGIIAGGYFILGFDGETPDQMRDTIRFAAESDLDMAYFFKATDYRVIVDIYKNWADESVEEISNRCAKMSYFSADHQDSRDKLINRMIMQAQSSVYLKPSRLAKGFFKSPRKLKFIAALPLLAGMLLYGFLLKHLQTDGVDG